MIAAVLAAMAVMPTAQAFVAPGSFVPGLSLRLSAVPAISSAGSRRWNVARSLRMDEQDSRTFDGEMTDAGRRELKDLEGQWKRVCVLGGSKGVGKDVVEMLSARGVEVVALVRREESKTELDKMPGVTAVLGNALEAADVIGVLDGCDACVSTLGGESAGVRVDYKGNMNAIENAGILGVTRMVLVTSVGAGDSKDAIPSAVYDTLKSALVDKTKAENLLIKYYTNTDYTIIRPGGLITAPATVKAIITEDKMASGAIHRADVARLAIDVLYSKKLTKKIVTAIDPSLAEAPAAYAAAEI